MAKHLDVRVHHLREICRDEHVLLHKVPASEQAADTFAEGTRTSSNLGTRCWDTDPGPYMGPEWE